MANSTLTYKGADWVASSVAGNHKKLNVMYVVYSNDGTSALDIRPDINADDYSNLTGGTWYMRITGSIVSSMTSSSDEYTNNSAIFSTIARKSDVVIKSDAPELTPSTSKIISVAVGYANNLDDASGDVIVSAGNITKSGLASPLAWVDGMDVSVSCPITITV